MKKVANNYKIHFNLVLTPEPEGGFTITVPTLPGLVSYAKSLKDVEVMAQDAIAGYLTLLQKRKSRLPKKDNSLFTSVSVEIPNQLYA